MSRGKIGRLPKNIQEEVNRKLEAKLPTREILPWLNQLPEVQEMIFAKYAGKPISIANLSNWRRGDFLKWQKSARVDDGFAIFLRRIEEAKKRGGADLSEDLPTYLAFAMAKECGILDDVAEPAERAERLDDLIGASHKLRRVGYTAGRRRIEHQKLADMRYAAERRRIKDKPKTPEFDEAYLKWKKRILSTEAPE